MMKRNIFLALLLFLLAGIAYGQSDTNRTDAKGRKQGLWKKYEGTTLLYEGRFLNDAPVGEFVYYHKNGKIKIRCTFLNGTTKVKTILFDEKGIKAAEGLFIDQQKDGVWTYFNEKGTTIKTESYKKGEKHGWWRTYSSQTGILLEENNYDNGQLNGVSRMFFVNGDIQSRITYINGKRNGNAETYYSDSVLCSKGAYHDNVPVGIWENRDGDGKLRKTSEYKDGKEDKVWLTFYNGNTPQKINRDIIAYLQKKENGTEIVMFSGATFLSSDEYDYVRTLLSLDDFCPVTPKLTAANTAIKGYEKLSSERILVKMAPGPDYDVISEGNEMRFVMMLFDRRPFKEE